MNPILIASILSFLQTIIQEEPKVAESIKNIFSKPNPTPEDWEAERVALLGKSYKDIVTNTDLPPA